MTQDKYKGDDDNDVKDDDGDDVDNDKDDVNVMIMVTIVMAMVMRIVIIGRSRGTCSHQIQRRLEENPLAGGTGQPHQVL